MIKEGQIVLFRFPQTDQTEGKVRPAPVLRQLPGQYNDWLICMISSQIDQKIIEFDEIISMNIRHMNKRIEADLVELIVNCEAFFQLCPQGRSCASL